MKNENENVKGEEINEINDYKGNTNNIIIYGIGISLVIFILFILLKRPKKKKELSKSLPDNIVKEIIDDFKPIPLCPPLSIRDRIALNDKIILKNQPGTLCNIESKQQGKIINFSNYDFLGYGERQELKDAASSALSKYGCGSCGPRGFYGTIDAHVYLEDAIAKFFGQEESIMYSDASSAVSSAIPAFSSRADLLVIDSGCNDAILTGCKLSRAKLRFFKHNDINDLQRILDDVEAEDKQMNRSTPQRRFIVIEGLYRNYGDIAPLDKIVEFKRKYKWRIFCDETCSFGVLGKHGIGITEHFNLPVSTIEILVASLATTLASVGGFCVGVHEVVEHQRLNGAGYCFSASAPPFLATVAQTALSILEKEGPLHLETLHKIKIFTINRLQSSAIEETQTFPNLFDIVSSNDSPIIHLRLKQQYRDTASISFEDNDEQLKNMSDEELLRLSEEIKLQKIVSLARERGILISMTHYIDIPSGVSSASSSDIIPTIPPPTIRVIVHSQHTEEYIMLLTRILREASAEVILGITRNQEVEEVDSNDDDDDEEVVETKENNQRAIESTPKKLQEEQQIENSESNGANWVPSASTLSIAGVIVGAASLLATSISGTPRKG